MGSQQDKQRVYVPAKYFIGEHVDQRKQYSEYQFSVPGGEYEGYVLKAPAFTVYYASRPEWFALEYDSRHPFTLAYKDPAAGSRHKRYKFDGAALQRAL